MKKDLIFIGLALLLVQVSLGAALAEDCSILRACVNQDGKTNCLPDDKECTYTQYENAEGACSPFSEDADADADAWTDGCDAFPSDAGEWMDIDADGVGHNSDCDDFDPENKEVCDTDDGGEDNDDPTIISGTNSGTLKVFCSAEWSCTEWTKCENQQKMRTCTKTNSCADETNKPEEKKYCPPEMDFSSKEEEAPAVEQPPAPEVEKPTQKSVTVDMQMPTDKGMTGVTGRVIDFAGGRGSFFFVVMIFGMLALIFLIAKRKK